MRLTVRARPVFILAGFVLFTLPLMPVQTILLRLDQGLARRFPHWYHRAVCRLLGVNLNVIGAVAADSPVLLVANHVSWLDIPVISAVAPVSFVAKKDVASWPFVATLARLQRTVFVDREARSKVGQTANEIIARLAAGDTIVLFAEGTSSDGNRVLPFKTSLFAAAFPGAGSKAGEPGVARPPLVQTLTIVYTRRSGLPLGWAGRRAMGYYGDIAMGANAWDVLSGGPLEATIKVSAPVALASFKDRKQLALWAEQSIRTAVVETLRG